MKRVIRPGTSVTQFFERFKDEEACLRHVFEVRWGDHTPCPKCGQLGRWTPIRGTKKYNHRCRRQTSVLQDTFLYRSNLSLMAWFYAMLLLANSSAGVRMSFIRRQLGLGTKSATRLCNRIRLHMASYERPARLGGPGVKVYIDEASIRYVASYRQLGSEPEPVTIMGFACDGQVIAGAIPNRRSKTFVAAIERFVRPGSVLVTDAHAGYKCLSSRGWEHLTVNHAVFFSDFKGNTLNEIETYWRVLKRTLASYRMIDAANLWLYLAEVEFRYNHRRSNRSAFEHLVSYFAAITDDTYGELRRKYDWR